MVPVVRDWLTTGLYPNLQGDIRADDVEAAVERIAVAGSPRDCAQAIRRLSAAGAASIILAPIGPDPNEQLERFAEEALPHIVADTVT
jgi:alkanesulfonate monooxygenase SsuD/methylene tetrahydromethanopterin reductase-like flavin-dependent oxidoreductase (luciferase family)